MIRRDFIKLSGYGMLVPWGLVEAARAAIARQPVDLANLPRAFNLPRGDPVTISGRDLDHLAMPVGGICAGQVYLTGDGRLRGWRVDGRTNPDPLPQDPFHAIVLSTRNEERGNARAVLASDRHGGSYRRVECLPAYPIADVAYVEGVDEAPPLSVVVRAGGPFIPLDPENSSLPCVVMRVQLSNPTDKAVKGSIGCILQNFIAMPGEGKAGPGVANRVARGEGYVAVEMSLADSGAVDAAQVGEVALACLGGTSASADEDPQAFDPLALTGRPRELGEYSGERRAAGAVAVGFDIEPGESREVVFIIAWRFPTHDHGRGAMYATRFAAALDVVRKMAQDGQRLLAQTDLFARTFYGESTLPWWILQRVMAPTSTLATRTCEWWADGMFHGRDFSGGPGGNSFQAWGPSQAEARLFPTLARSVRIMQELGSAMDPQTGAIAARGGLAPGEGATIDSQATALLKLMREHVSDSGETTLREHTERFRKAAIWLLAQDIADSPSGEPDGRIASTWATRFGESLPGTNPYQSGMYHAGILAGARFARLLGDGPATNSLLDAFMAGRTWAAHRTFADGFFSDRTLGGERTEASGVCFAPQILGPVLARHVDLTPVWADDRVRHALETIARHNWTMGDATVDENDMVTPGADAGVRLHARPADQSSPKPLEPGEIPHTAFEYELASGLISYGDEKPSLIHAGLSVLKALDIRARQTGRNPFDELGGHAPGAMAAWNVYHALTGFVHDGTLAGTIGNMPRVQENDHSAFFVGGTAWGRYIQRRTPNAHASRWEVRWGSLRILEVQTRPPRGMGTKGPVEMVIRTRERQLAGSMIQDETRAAITFVVPITLGPGEYIEVAWMW